MLNSDLNDVENNAYQQAITSINNPKASTTELLTAEKTLNLLLNRMPQSSCLYTHLVMVYAKLGYHRLALLCAEQALSWGGENDDQGQLRINLANIHFLLQEFVQAIPLLSDAYEIETSLQKRASICHQLISACQHIGDYQQAINYADKLLTILPKDSKARWQRAICYLQMGNYQQGFCADYEYGTLFELRGHKIYSTDDIPVWQGEPNKTIVVYGEQGLGDEILFASMIPDLLKTAKHLILDVHQQLQAIFQQSFPTATVYGTRHQQDVAWLNKHAIDAKIAIASLGQFYRQSASDFRKTPYLIADKSLVTHYQKKLRQLSSKPKIGISWKGGTEATSQYLRHIALEKFIPLFDVIDADYISLQYHQDAQQDIDLFMQKHPNYHIHHWPDMVANYSETAALVKNLDCIISVPQSVIHLTGALGIKGFQLATEKLVTLWTVGVHGKASMDWYASIHNLWQARDETWESVIQRLIPLVTQHIQEFRTNEK